MKLIKPFEAFLTWLKMDFDEDVDTGGGFGPWVGGLFLLRRNLMMPQRMPPMRVSDTRAIIPFMMYGLPFLTSFWVCCF
ncbi:MAG: hypothetical protein P9L93_03110, partial [Candidatus Gorgyraea atricola]|nr:hypothetical protein [Candidatus Gorgyraea atricola]